MGTGITDYIREIFNNIYDYLEELNRAIFETREIIEITKIATFCCIGLLILFFIIAMARISGLKRDNEELRNNVKKLDEKINSLTGIIQGFLIASQTRTNSHTSNENQNTAKTSDDTNKEFTGIPNNVREEIKQQIAEESSNEEKDKSDKIIIGFVVICFIIIFFAILVAAFSNMK